MQVETCRRGAPQARRHALVRQRRQCQPWPPAYRWCSTRTHARRCPGLGVGSGYCAARSAVLARAVEALRPRRDVDRRTPRQRLRRRARGSFATARKGAPGVGSQGSRHGSALWIGTLFAPYRINTCPQGPVFIGVLDKTRTDIWFIYYRGPQTNLSGQAPPWNVDVATDCIRRLGGTPSQENVRRIIKLRSTAAQLRADAGSSAPGDGSRRGT